MTQSPASLVVTAPESADFRAATAATGGCSTLTRWQVSTNHGASYTNLGTAGTDALVITGTHVSMSGNRYRAVFIDRAGSVATSAATLTVKAAPGSLPSTGSQLFSPTSIWNQPVAASAPVDPSSPERMAALMNYINPPGPGVWLNSREYSVPVYRVPADQPTVPVTLDNNSPALAEAWQAVPIPPAARPAPGTDASAVVYQPSTDKMWEFWQLSRQADGLHARWGGAMANVSTSAGFYSPFSWSGLTPEQGWDWGSSASSLPAIAGLMTIHELKSGHVNHALSVAMPQACKWYVWPSQRTDGTSSDSNCLPEGAHLRLDPNLNLANLNLSPMALMMAQAMQRYGVIVHDTTNSSVTFYAEQPSDGTDPYNGPNGIFAGAPEWQFLRTIPWDHLQLLKLGPQCTQGPCSSS